MNMHRFSLVFGALIFLPCVAWSAPTPSAPSLAKVSEQAVDHLAHPLRIDLYHSPKAMPAELQSTGRDVLDILDRYAKAARGKLTWKVIDPSTAPNEEKRRTISEAARQCGVMPIRRPVEREDRIEITSHYLGLCFTYGSRSKAFPQITSSLGLEFAITAIIKGMTEPKPTIAFTTGHGELTPEAGLGPLRSDLEEDFNLVLVNPAREAIGESVAALVVGGPRQAFDDRGRRELDRFLSSGGNAVLLVDGAVLEVGGKGEDGRPLPSTIRPHDAGLDPVLAKYGFQVGHAFVADPQGDTRGILCPLGNNNAFPSTVCVAPLVKEDPSRSLFDGVSAIVFPYASPVDRLKAPPAATAAEGTFIPLAGTDNRGVVITGSLTLGWQFKLPKAKKRGPFTFGYAFQGTRPTNPKAPGLAGADRPIRRVVIGDSDFISSEMLQLAKLRPSPVYSGGAQLFLNAVRWLVEDEALARLRTNPYRTEDSASPSP